MSNQFVNNVPTTWTSQPSTDTTVVPNVPVKYMVVWDAGLVTPYSSTTWDNGTTNWIA